MRARVSIREDWCIALRMIALTEMDRQGQEAIEQMMLRLLERLEEIENDIEGS